MANNPEEIKKNHIYRHSKTTPNVENNNDYIQTDDVQSEKVNNESTYAEHLDNYQSEKRNAILKELEDDYVNEEDASVFDNIYSKSLKSDSVENIKDANKPVEETIFVDDFHKVLKEEIAKDEKKENKELNKSLFNAIEEVNNQKKERRFKKFFNKYKMFFISFLTIIIVFAIIVVVRLVKVNKQCKKLISNDLYSKIDLVETLQRNGYGDFEINFALSSNDIDFATNAMNYIYELADSQKTLIKKNDIEAKLLDKGYTQKDIDYALEHVSWNDFLLKYANTYISSNDNANKAELLNMAKSSGYSVLDSAVLNDLDWSATALKNVQKFLSEKKEYGRSDAQTYLQKYQYTSSEIEYAISKTDWKKQALNYITNYLTNNDDVDPAKSNLKDVLEKADFEQEEIDYALDKYDFSEVLITRTESLIEKQKPIISKSKIYDDLTKSGFDEEEINQAFSKIVWKDYALSTCESMVKDNYNKTAAIKYLSQNGYTNNEISSIDTEIKWNEYAVKAFEKLLEDDTKGKNEVIAAVKNYGYNNNEVNEAIDKIDWKSHAYEYVKNNKSTFEYSVYTRSGVKSLLNKVGYSSEIDSVLSEFDWGQQALDYVSAIVDSRCATTGSGSGKIGPSTWTETELRNLAGNQGFTSNEFMYAYNNLAWDNFVEKWTKVYKEYWPYPSRQNLVNNLKQMGFSDSRIKKAREDIIKDTDWPDLAYKYALNQCGGHLDDEQFIRSTLSSAQYTNQEIDYVLIKLNAN